MRILQVLHSPGCGGAENHALKLMLGLRDKGHEILYAGSEDSWLADKCRQNEIEVAHVRMRGMLDLGSYVKLRRTIKKWRPDIVHAHLVRASHFAGLAKIGTGVPAVSTAHATTAHKHMRRSRRIIAVAEAVKANLLRYDYAAEKITVIHNGVADCPVRFSRAEARQKLNIAADEFAVVCVGRFVHDKGQDLLVRAFETLPENARLHLIGDAETDFGKTVARLAAGNGRRIRFHGFRDDVEKLLPAFDVYAAPSRREALSLALAEASAAALPIVACDVGGIPEVVVHEKTGLLIPAEDIVGLARSIRRFMDEPLLSAQFAAAARQRFQEEFTFEKMLQKTLGVYAAALSPADVA